MKKEKIRILSLDVSSVSTGWCYSVGRRTASSYGIIKTDPKLDISERLIIFKNELIRVLNKRSPTHVVIENGFSGRNVKTLKVLTKFAGVAQECIKRETDITPYVMNNKTVKSFFGVKTKRELYDAVVEKHMFWTKGFKFKTHNDIVDAWAQALCYYVTIIEGEE